MNVWQVTAVAVVLFTAILLLTFEARSQERCQDEQAMIAMLERQYAEHVIVKLPFTGGHFVITRSAWGMWTMLRVTEGKACIVGAGAKSTVDRGI